jgi:hypothetical protein
MKKRILMCIIASAMICGTFASCGTNDSSDSKTDTETTTAATTTAVEETEASTEELTEPKSTTIPRETEEETTTKSETTDDHSADAAAILEKINLIDIIAGGAGVDTDSADKKEEDAFSFEKVTDKRFTTLEDVKKFVTDAVTGTLLDRYDCLYEGEGAYFKEFDGVLYFKNAPIGCGFSYTDKPVVSDVTDDSFTITVNFDNFGGSSELKIKAVKEDDMWKASSFSVDGGIENAR